MHVRVPCQIDSSFTDLDANSADAQGETLVNDLSEGGIRFRAGRFIPIQNKLLFRLRPPGKKTIEALAQPAWIKEIPSVNQFDIGAKFISLSDSDRAIIRSFVQNF